jgi:hypothetical protein
VPYEHLAADITEEKPLQSESIKLIDRTKSLDDLYGGQCAMEQGALMKAKI